MARIRSIKPEFWSDDTVTECSLSARLLFIGTWNFADDAGNLDRSAKQIKTRVFPIDSIDCEPLIQELIEHGLLIEYSVEGKKYLHIPGFADHQLINRPSKPVVPGYVKPQGVLTEDSVSNVKVGLSTHSGGEGRGEEGRGESAGAPHGRSARPGSERRASRIPDDFALTTERRAVATAERIDPERTFAKFRDYWRAKSGSGATKLDWDATWRNWCRSEGDRNPQPKGGADNGLPFAN